MNQSFTPREFIDKINAENPGQVFDPYDVKGLVTVQDQEPSVAKDLIAKAQEDAKLQPNLDMDVLISQLKDIDAKIEMVSQPSELERLLKEKNELVSQFFRDSADAIFQDIDSKSYVAERSVSSKPEDSKVLDRVKDIAQDSNRFGVAKLFANNASSKAVVEEMHMYLDTIVLKHAMAIAQDSNRFGVAKLYANNASSKAVVEEIHQALDIMVFKHSMAIAQYSNRFGVAKLYANNASSKAAAEAIHQVLDIMVFKHSMAIAQDSNRLGVSKLFAKNASSKAVAEKIAQFLRII
jgi:hypothetical protein